MSSSAKRSAKRSAQRRAEARRRRAGAAAATSLPYTWDAFTERPAPLDGDGLVSPASEVGSLLQRYQGDLGAARSAARDATDAARAVAVEQAVLVAQLDRAIGRMSAALTDAKLVREHRQLRVIKDQMLDALAGGGITVDDPVGRPFHAVADQVEVVGWRHAPEFEAEVVAESQEPVVLYKGAVVRRGTVVMGAPPPDAPARDAPPSDAPPQDAPPQDAPPQDAPPEDAPTPEDASPMQDSDKREERA